MAKKPSRKFCAYEGQYFPDSEFDSQEDGEIHKKVPLHFRETGALIEAHPGNAEGPLAEPPEEV